MLLYLHYSDSLCLGLLLLQGACAFEPDGAICEVPDSSAKFGLGADGRALLCGVPDHNPEGVGLLHLQQPLKWCAARYKVTQ